VVREAFGFAEPGPEDHVHHNELKVVPAIQLQLSEGFRPVVIGRWLRVCGTACAGSPRPRRPGWHSEVVMALLASGMAEVEVLAAQADLGSRMAPSASRRWWPSTTGGRNTPGARAWWRLRP
jgi:hypothetical protein